ncbi:MAG: ABC transporter ATP-binding protein [Monoglobaceae bacterium]
MSDEQNSMIEIKNLSKTYGMNKVLDDISFSVKRGEIMGFLGPNGAGKSTTMNIVTGYLSSSGGKVFIDGINIDDNPIAAKRKIGYLPEIPPLYPEMTVREYLDFVYDLKGVSGKRDAHLRKVMSKVHIYDVRGRMIRNLSKGYKQRVGLAQALIGDPEVLILDEPTVGLDPMQIMEIRSVISELGQERTVVLSTHIMQEVTAVCDSYTIINHGRIAASGSMADFSEDKSAGCRIRVKSDADTACRIAQAAENISEVNVIGSFEDGTVDLSLIPVQGADIRESVFNTFSAAGCPILMLSRAKRSLEEEFMLAISGENNDVSNMDAEASEASKGSEFSEADTEQNRQNENFEEEERK